MARRDRELDAFEDMLVEAFGNMRWLRDPERGWQGAGSRSCWPAIVRDRIADYADSEGVPRRVLSRREALEVHGLFIDQGCLAEVVPVERRALVGVVLADMAFAKVTAGRWERVWARMGGRACGATSDALRVRYETQLGRMHAAWACRVRDGRWLAGLRAA